MVFNKTISQSVVQTLLFRKKNFDDEVLSLVVAEDNSDADCNSLQSC